MSDPSKSLPTLGLDLDGCIDEAPELFRTLSTSWPGRVVVITLRDDRKKTIADLDQFGIHYDELVLVRAFSEKACAIAEHRVDVYFDDQPEMLREVASNVRVCLFRNEGNFDFEDRRWMLSKATGKIV